MKPNCLPSTQKPITPAAFGRLCVETVGQQLASREDRPAAFGRLCVETGGGGGGGQDSEPAAFGRLCVETVCKRE